MIHTFGDSHASNKYTNWNACKNVITHHLGPMLCYTFGTQKLARFDIRKYNVKNGDTVIFCLGEIDCRCHIHKHVNNGNNYKKIITDIVDNYIDTVLLNIQVSGLKLKHICIYNVVPTVRKDTIPDANNKTTKYPLLGSDEERKEYVLYFNKLLKEKCAKNSLVFFDVYDQYCDDDGFLNRELSDGNVHIQDVTHIVNFINTILL